ncbi:hypothetical protein [Polymorphobacter fuscus]|uniref:Uncharacterized protein n=1 Tax=Sandarakinorhabdus fusca TaxID=1439888 RepID=A0A7C9KJN9_9SPHN|nr:hypothetical protein [Polymorphobacter fuscus]KAB7644932.1 hypothetical protein F9290_13230 [Polymorphobacter fuscus]MQT18219.1 hypothetical protein [Polymorphobacter fuscus]NJC09541.1 hypothetical protein [Polymorphobacter fuscus]
MTPGGTGSAVGRYVATMRASGAQVMTHSDETSDFDLVRQDPAAWYTDPQAILDDRNLSRSEQQALLAEWAQDLGDRIAAADEGMVPEGAGSTDADVRMRDHVTAAQAALESLPANDSILDMAARIWRRITGGDQADPAKVTE